MVEGQTTSAPTSNTFTDPILDARKKYGVVYKLIIPNVLWVGEYTAIFHPLTLEEYEHYYYLSLSGGTGSQLSLQDFIVDKCTIYHSFAGAQQIDSLPADYIDAVTRDLDDHIIERSDALDYLPAGIKATLSRAIMEKSAPRKTATGWNRVLDEARNRIGTLDRLKAFVALAFNLDPTSLNKKPINQLLKLVAQAEEVLREQISLPIVLLTPEEIKQQQTAETSEGPMTQARMDRSSTQINRALGGSGVATPEALEWFEHNS